MKKNQKINVIKKYKYVKLQCIKFFIFQENYQYFVPKANFPYFLQIKRENIKY